MELDLSADQKDVLEQFLDTKDRDELLEEWLIEFGLSPGKAKVVVKVVLPLLIKAARGTGQRAAKWLDDALRNRFDFYDKLTVNLGRKLLFKIESQALKKKQLDPHLEAPEGVTSDNWKQLNEQTRVWIKQLEQLDLIALSLGKLTAQVKLRLDKSGLRIGKEGLDEILEKALSFLLHPYNALIPLIGRDNERQTLLDFCNAEGAFLWRVKTGEAGVGKTRLAQDLARKMQDDGWDAGFLDSVPLAHLTHHDQFSQWQPLTDTLIVVDDAASSLDHLERLFDRCTEWAQEAQDDPDRPKLRLVLLERHASPDTGWLSSLLETGSEALRDSIKLALREIKELHALGLDGSAMLEILQETMKSWDKLYGKSPPKLPKFDEDGIRKLHRNTEGRPLYLQMAALHACEIGDARKLIHWGRSELLQEAVKRERQYIEKQYPDKTNRTLVERAAALLFLTGTGSVDDQKWLKLLRKDAQACGYIRGPGTISDFLVTLYGETEAEGEKRLKQIQPDLVGAAFAATVLEERPNTRQKILQHMILGFGTLPWPNLLRAAIDLYGIAEYKVDEWLPLLVSGRTPEELWLIANLLPEQSISLALFAVALYEELLKIPLEDEKRAAALNNLGGFYSALGKRQEALEAGQKAVEVYERLAAKNPDAYEPDLAMSLNNLGNRYSALGKRQEALATGQKAVEIRKRLAAKNPDAYEPDLAMSLGALGSTYLAGEKPHDACANFRQGVQTLKRLFMRNPQAFDALMGNLVKNYLIVCQASGVEPDQELLRPIVERLQAED